MGKTVLAEPPEMRMGSTPGPPAAPVVGSSDAPDWDAIIELSPPRRSGLIRVTLKAAGRSRPIPVEESFGQE